MLEVLSSEMEFPITRRITPEPFHPLGVTLQAQALHNLRNKPSLVVHQTEIAAVAPHGPTHLVFFQEAGQIRQPPGPGLDRGIRLVNPEFPAVKRNPLLFKALPYFLPFLFPEWQGGFVLSLERLENVREVDAFGKEAGDVRFAGFFPAQDAPWFRDEKKGEEKG